MSVESSQLESLTRVSWRARPASFVALMSIYESNYIRAGWLMGDPRALTGQHVSAVESDCELVLTVNEQSPYTTSLNLTYRLGSECEHDLLPDMTVRVYHDARMAEARCWSGHHRHRLLQLWRSRAEREMDQRWARNMMLNKWLEYCVDRGHRFAPGLATAT